MSVDVDMPPEEFAYFAELILERAGIAIEPVKQYLIRARMAPILGERGIPDLAGLIELLRSRRDDALETRVVEAMTTNETSFFRDRTPFELLRDPVIPELVGRNQTIRRLDFWSAACATGQEAYSIAITLREHFPELMHWHAGIVASDLSAAVVARAEAGSYSQVEVNRGVSRPLLEKYFVPEGLGWRVRPDIRRMIDFRPINLIRPPVTLPTFDVVFLRNVLIYLAPESRRRVLERVRRSMRPGAYLFLGGTESLRGDEEGFELVEWDRGRAYRVNGG